MSMIRAASLAAFLAGLFGLGLAAVLVLFAPPARAAETPFARTQGAEVRLLAGAVKDGALEAGVEIRLAPGWKTYWRYPGDSGIPPRFDWSNSRNVSGVTVAFPAPRRFSDGGGGYSVGYKGSVVLPVRVALTDPARATRLDLSLDFAVCDALCVPAHVQISLDVPPGGGDEPGLAFAAAALPVKTPLGAPGSLGIQAVSVDTSQAPPVVVVKARGGPKADLFAEGPTEAWALPLPSREEAADGSLTFRFALDGLPKDATWPGAMLRLTLSEQGKAIETQVPLQQP
ncbi:hypothetical protein J5J86_06325 [Aquabacter sp. L1I39]|uniref:protein-disulfide reductase DsbD domain-containing protein n=1 Tax=Aquabacter sp. L1I39 TaxID=2820278 RepID=UPI001ADA2033|nr:protein-disulfide reductase DsbD domain-containing protein [Aquabacter sp. L1I39]QTL04925.1 hypothetical protein J5J86_06325 [Aquabacter sp. L1I39]